jgi:hypothetical protein
VLVTSVTGIVVVSAVEVLAQLSIIGNKQIKMKSSGDISSLNELKWGWSNKLTKKSLEMKT